MYGHTGMLKVLRSQYTIENGIFISQNGIGKLQFQQSVKQEPHFIRLSTIPIVILRHFPVHM